MTGQLTDLMSVGVTVERSSNEFFLAGLPLSPLPNDGQLFLALNRFVFRLFGYF